MKSTRPIAVLISDIHYSLSTLELADKATRMAIDKANSLNVPLIVAGDLHNTKANLRAECVNAMLKTFKTAKIKPYVLVGNHDLVNERSAENALEFLNDTVILVRTPMSVRLSGRDIILSPYFSEATIASTYFASIPRGATVIAHQGLKNSHAGEYISDKSAVSWSDVQHLRVISGHYHTRQTIRTSVDSRTYDNCVPSAESFDYIGNPYTLNFGEASDPEKGFQILNDDGSLTFVPTSLRKHVIIDLYMNTEDILVPRSQDLIWVRIHGSKENISTITRKHIEREIERTNFKLDYYPTDSVTSLPAKTRTQSELLDDVIEGTSNVSDEQKERLKTLWRSFETS